MPPHPVLELDTTTTTTTGDKQTPEDQAQSPTGEFIRNLLNHVRTRSMSLFGLWPKIPTGLCDAEREIYQTLLETLRDRAAKGQKPPHLLVITDLAKDYDDLMAMVLLGELHRLGLVELEAFVANLMPAQSRARFGRGALDLLGLRKIPIGIGTEGSEKLHKVNDYEFKYCTFMAPAGSVEFENGEELLLKVLRKAAVEKRKVTLLLLSSLMDISKFSQKYPNLVKNTVDNISIQGGMYFEKGTLKADNSAANNNFSPDHATYFTKFIQDNNIPTTVYTKVAAFATKIYSEFFAELSATGHPLGVHLRKTQLAQDVNFYTDTMDEKTRFRPFMTQQWFLTNKSTWFEGHSEDPNVEPYPLPEQVVPYLTVVVAYDALAALGAAGEDVLTNLRVLKPATGHPSFSSCCRIVGVSPSSTRPDALEDPGVYGDRMADAIKALVKGSLLSSLQQLT